MESRCGYLTFMPLIIGVPPPLTIMSSSSGTSRTEPVTQKYAIQSEIKQYKGSPLTLSIP